MVYIRSFSILILVLYGSIMWAGCGNDESRQTNRAGSDTVEPSGGSPSAFAGRDLRGPALEGRTDIIRKAVEQGVDIDEKDPSGRTLLMLASYNGHADLVQYLLVKGADPQISDHQGRTALIFAASGPFPEAVETLLEHGADPDKTDKKEGWSALMWGAAEGNGQVVRVLLEHGADPNLRDSDGETARTFAAANGHGKIAELLKQAENGK